MAKVRKSSKGNREFWCHIRLTEQEHKLLKEKLSSTTFQKVSEYARSALFDKPITVLTRDRSMDEFMWVLIGLRGDLLAISKNFNQVVKKVNSIPKTDPNIWVPYSLEMQGELLKRIAEIQKKIDVFSNKWLQ
ncbi:plasmid mobilization protein [Longitalea luteola]|uniref:plasmid mobilization protein n=1 Tax=Longitalea luteola TaxID=2812563 RepID=UPI001A977093|nr:hypothetical protein [Longitalea luteola]